MLARTAGLSHVCLRCQRRLLTDRGPLEAPSYPSTFVSGRRWGHSAVQIQQDDDNDHQDGGQPENTDLSSSTSNSEPVAERSYRFRRWRPSKTANLGVNSLGKPAEVLILPSRDRRIPQVPKDEENKARVSVQESLASEQAPLSIQDLMANIEQVVRSSGIEKKRGQLEVKEWEILRSSLAQGFKLDQMRRYIAYKRKKSLSTDAFHRVNRQNKPDTIKYLVEEVWGFTVPVTEKSSKQRQRSLSLYVPDEAKLDHLLKDRGQPLKRIAEELDVQIDLFRRESRIRVAGTTANAAAALARISRVVKDLQPIMVPLRGAMAETYRDPALKHLVRPFLDSVQQRFDVQIALTSDHIKIVHNENHRLSQQAHRVIRLAVETEDDPHKIEVWPPESKESSSLQPFPSPAEFSRGLLQLPWTRFVNSAIDTPPPRTRHPDNERITLLDTMLSRIRDWLNAASMVKKPKPRHELHYHTTAKFGQALFREPPQARIPHTRTRSEVESPSPSVSKSKDRSEDMENTGKASEASADVLSKGPSLHLKSAAGNERVSGAVNSNAPSTFPTPSLTSQIPYLVQQLALIKQWNQGTSTTAKDIDPDARVTLRLEFSPIYNGPHSQYWPTFEAFVTSGDSLEGKRPPLNIAKISAVHQQKSFTILCPSRDVDVTVTQELRQDLLYRGSEKNQHYTSLLRTIKGYFSRAEADEPTDWLFQPFITLPLDDRMKGIADKVESAVKQGKTFQQQHVAQTVATKKESIAYILRTVDVMDVDSREIAVGLDVDSAGKQRNHETVKFCLDHVTLTGTEATRQELCLSERSLLQPPPLTPTDVTTLTKTALELADRLGKDPTASPSTLAEFELKLHAKDLPGEKKKKTTGKKPKPSPKVLTKAQKPAKKASSSSKSRGKSQASVS
ncbi:hypothetical protein A1O3_00959 [Capronia epimyces CBS 606.96]|uniref:Uncharacterized protein n=1 Tax=Capronia epimyces CBS 606.96 TaxID=1182542 RepID=W9YIS3_9EURO|nr:uncharacterized protein A1O3_00959 [Capronia epimyces CBS 606.96]EXJ92408.1 hypothetical protein A1O3_00959 [Capronia epimyces CBS 606.96]